VLDRCYAANGGDPITYFEITTCAALLGLRGAPADYTLLEVGLGGRLDATNVVDRPAPDVITPVSMDHQQFLGDTLAEIAGEKAGIIKRGVPCVVGPQEDAALEVIEARGPRARRAAPRPWPALARVWEERGRLVFQDETGLLDLPLPNLPGAHQIENAGSAGRAAPSGPGRGRLRGRDDRMPTGPPDAAPAHGPLVEAAPGAELWLDGGHNPARASALAEALRACPRGRRT
jgi:dihydrofolate synthase/folylpolyglutamate synthase